MVVLNQLFSALNRMVESDIKQQRTNGFFHLASREVLCGSEHAFRLPIGLSAAEVNRKLDSLIAAAGAPIELIDRSGAIVVRVIKKDFPSHLKFKPHHLKNDQIVMGYNRLLEPVYHPINTHLLVGGASKSGKTDWLRWVVYQLIRQKYLVFISDLKGISFFPFESIPGVSVYDNLELARNMLVILVAELERRKALIKQSRNRDISKSFQRIAFIGDEGAVFSPNQHTGEMKKIAQECEGYIAYLGQQAREFQMFGIMCYQRPDERTINKQYKANVEASIAFRTKDGANSWIILDREGAEKISPTTPGRCIYAYDRDYTLQVPYVGDDREWEKILSPLKMEVLHHGKSHRTEAQRTYIDGSFTSAPSDNQATIHAQSVLGSAKESLSHSKGTGKRKARQEHVPRTRKSMATVSDEVD